MMFSYQPNFKWTDFSFNWDAPKFLKNEAQISVSTSKTFSILNILYPFYFWSFHCYYSMLRSNTQNHGTLVYLMIVQNEVKCTSSRMVTYVFSLVQIRGLREPWIGVNLSSVLVLIVVALRIVHLPLERFVLQIITSNQYFIPSFFLRYPLPSWCMQSPSCSYYWIYSLKWFLLIFWISEMELVDIPTFRIPLG